MLLRQRFALMAVLLGLVGVVVGELAFLTAPPGRSDPDDQTRVQGVEPQRAQLTGVVSDTQGNPVAGATVQLIRQEAGSSTRRRWTQSDASGRFVLADLSPSLFRLRARADGYLTLDMGALQISRETVQEPLEVVLERTPGSARPVTSRVDERLHRQ